MRVTVVIPLYNKRAQISRTLDSLVSQQHRDWEAIVVDDGSSDDGAAVVERFEDARVRCIRQDNQGVSAARNTGVAHATTEWVSFLDGDDEYLPEFLDRLIGFVESEGDGANLVMVSSNYRLGVDGEPAYDVETRSGIQDYFALCPGSKTPVCSSSALVRRSMFEAVGGFPPGVKSFEDWTCWMKLGAAGSYGFISEVLAVYHKDEPDTASRRPRPTAGLMADAEILLGEARRIASNKNLSEGVHRRVTRYANRFVLRCAAPFLRRNGDRVRALRLLKHYAPLGFEWRHLIDMARFLKGIVVPVWIRRMLKRQGGVAH